MNMVQQEDQFLKNSRFGGLRVILLTGEMELQEGYALRYKSYLNEGAIQPNKTRRFIDNYDLHRTSLMIGVVNQRGRVVGSIRFAVQPPISHGIMDFRSSPEFQVFPDVVHELEKDDRPIASGARFSVEPCNPRRSEIALLLMMAQVTAARAAGAKWGIATARGSHLHFYRRFLSMKPLCEARKMPNLAYCYTLLGSDLDTNFGESIQSFPETLRTYFEREHPFWTSQVANALPEFSVRGVA